MEGHEMMVGLGGEWQCQCGARYDQDYDHDRAFHLALLDPTLIDGRTFSTKPPVQPGQGKDK